MVSRNNTTVGIEPENKFYNFSHHEAQLASVLVKRLLYVDFIEPRREKTGFLHMRKQKRRSASR